MYFLQVLTGELPFRGILDSALAYYVLRGKRPDKPGNASAIGFSDSLWNFTERCWDGKMESRPAAGDVVSHLVEAAANWKWPMPPCVQANVVVPGSDASDSIRYSAFDQFKSSLDIAHYLMVQINSSSPPQAPPQRVPWHRIYHSAS